MGTSGSSRHWKEVHEVKIISLIIRFYLLFSFSFFDEYTVEFSRDSICESIIALTTRGRCLYIYLSSQFYLPMQQITTNIRHINKISLGSSIIFKLYNGPKTKKFQNCHLRPCGQGRLIIKFSSSGTYFQLAFLSVNA